jgi:hypothetical protein
VLDLKGLHSSITDMRQVPEKFEDRSSKRADAFERQTAMIL